MTFRFLHASDLHLGKPFGRLSRGYPQPPARGASCRHRASGPGRPAGRHRSCCWRATVSTCGNPAPDTLLRRPFARWRRRADIRWIMLPGNHDSLAATELWRRIATDGPANLKPLLDDGPVTLADDVWLLPAPCTQRPRRARPGRSDGRGHAARRAADRPCHGPVTDFDEGDGRTGIIPPDRAARSGLDYLALGDCTDSARSAPRPGIRARRGRQLQA